MTSPHNIESNTTQENNESDTTCASISAIRDDGMSASITVDEGEGGDNGGQGDNGEGGDDDDNDDYGDGDGDGDEDLEMTVMKDVVVGAEVWTPVFHISFYLVIKIITKTKGSNPNNSLGFYFLMHAITIEFPVSSLCCKI